jgi:hypothetical protein
LPDRRVPERHLDQGGKVATDIPDTGPDLEISNASRIALEAAQALTLTLERSVGPARLFTASISTSLIAAAGAVVTQSLPDCPFAPAGVAVQPDWNPTTHNYMLRCQHPGHCWDHTGVYYPCP